MALQDITNLHASGDGRLPQHNLCTLCLEPIRGVLYLQDGQVCHFSCVDKSRPHILLRTDGAHPRDASQERTVTAQMLQNLPRPLRAHQPRGVRPRDGPLSVSENMPQQLGSHRSAPSVQFPPRYTSFLSSSSSSTDSSPGSRASTPEELLSQEIDLGENVQAHNRILRAFLMSGEEVDLQVEDDQYFSDIRSRIAKEIGCPVVEVMLTVGAKCLQGNWRVEDVFGDAGSVEISAVVTKAKIPFEDMLDPTEPTTDYASDNFAKMRRDETKFTVRADFMAFQQDVNTRMRTILVDWLVDVQVCLKLKDETLFLGIRLLDRYLQVKQVRRRDLQLVGVVCMVIAAKLQGDKEVPFTNWIHMTSNAYSERDIADFECKAINAFGFDLTEPTSLQFLELYKMINRRSGRDEPNDLVREFLAHYILELSLVFGPCVFEPTSSYTASMLAASSIHLSQKLIKTSPTWSERMAMYTGYTKEELTPCTRDLCRILDHLPGQRLGAVQKKFAKEEYLCVSKMPYRAC
eukprot:gb/GFBE01011722.1/.p1 GENE.gb/GFBE01011722.1/~~gb/GFBE01011722.1/.p1  ORF type:complete len:519 (+),score=80.46 gb/GFBE01011722.1/:1-1557(+)